VVEQLSASMGIGMRTSWRFFVGPDGRWRWQELGPDGVVIKESAEAFDTYETCVGGATKSGYVFATAQGRTVRPGNGDRSWRRT
jgi:hypothetical protein